MNGEEFVDYNPRDRIYLTEIQVPNDPYNDTNMLFCDAKGILSTGHTDDDTLRIIEATLSEYKKRNKYASVLCLEIENSQSVSFGVEIDYEEALSLNVILTMFRDNKIKNATIPEKDIPLVANIIKKGKQKLTEKYHNN